MEERMNINTFIGRFIAGDFYSADVKTQIEAGWFDWFCKDESLRNKTYSLVGRLKKILPSKKFDREKTYVLFKNNCRDKFYDDFRICDIESRDVIYTVIPKDDTGKSEVWGLENDFRYPLIVGDWQEVIDFFLENCDDDG